MPCASSRPYFFVGIIVRHSNGFTLVQDVLVRHVGTTCSFGRRLFSNDPTWARFWLGNENLREQLVLPEVLFRTVCSSVPRQGPIVADMLHSLFRVFVCPQHELVRSIQFFIFNWLVQYNRFQVHAAYRNGEVFFYRLCLGQVQ